MRTLLLGAIGVVSGFLNGLLGAGGGTIVVPALEKFLHYPVRRAHATAISVILPLSMVSAYFYLSRGQLDLKIAAVTGFFGIFGGIIGARLLGKLPPQLIKGIFAVSMLILGGRQLWS